MGQQSAAYVERLTFGQKLTMALDEGLRDALGEEAARSIGFFVDPRIALKDSKKYWASLDKLFNHRTDLLLSKLVDKISESFGITKGEYIDFVRCVGAAKEKFVHDDIAERGPSTL
jgi:hypothetical protein